MVDEWWFLKERVLDDYIALMLQYYGDDPDLDDKEREPFQITIFDIRGKMVHQRLREHIHAWCEANKNLLLEVWEEFGLSTDKKMSIGHDLFFTAGGHGCGFWDGWDIYVDNLTAAAEKFPDLDFYVGDDGQIYESPQLEVPVERKY